MSSLLMTAMIFLLMTIVVPVSSQCDGDTCSTTSALSRAVRMAENRQPFIPRAEQDAAADAKLSEVLAQNNNKRPNFVWLVVDDMGYGDAGGLWGGGARIGAATPNINKMSANGLSLMATYSQPTCTPSRAAMMTGRLPVRTGMTRPILVGDTVLVNPWANETSIAQQLSDNGYHTILSGKWHCGEMEGQRPFDVGFDEFQGYYGAQKEITQRFDARRYPDLVLNEELLTNLKNTNQPIDMYYGKKGDTEQTVVEPTTSIEQFAEADKKIAQFTIDKIKELATKDKPFFIAHNFLRVHADNWPSQEFRGKSASKYPYKDNMVEVDHHVGAILAALEDAGVANNTFVFFTSDNGPQMDGWPDAGYTPFKGGKSTTWEGGVRVPGIAYWPGVIEPRVSDELFDFMDLYNSMLKIAGVDMETELEKLPDMYIDGIDQTSFLLMNNGESKREHVYMWASTNFMALRMREYKYHVKVVTFNSPFQIIDYANMDDVGLAPWLFNLYIDPKEQLPVGHRRNAWLATMGSEATQLGKTFVKYPMKNVGL